MRLSTGHDRRLGRICLPAAESRLLVVPIDDSLIAGPRAGLCKLDETVRAIARARPSALLAFPAQLERFAGLADWRHTGWIGNLTASSTRSTHSRKVQIASVERAVAIGCDAVAVHLNVSSTHEPEMLRALGEIVERARTYGMPVVAISYPRRELTSGADENYEDMRANRPEEFSNLVAHCVRIAVDLGASVVKTIFTGTASSFEPVVSAALGAPLVVAGGPLVSEEAALSMAAEAVLGGASGISFGRNVFNRDDPEVFLNRLHRLVDKR